MQLTIHGSYSKCYKLLFLQAISKYIMPFSCLLITLLVCQPLTLISLPLYLCKIFSFDYWSGSVNRYQPLVNFSVMYYGFPHKFLYIIIISAFPFLWDRSYTCNLSNHSYTSSAHGRCVKLKHEHTHLCKCFLIFHF